jgi:hypothetical protein
MKIKITKSKLKEIVQEEAAKFKKALALKKELGEIEQQLNEVKAGAPLDKDGVHAGQRKAVFSTKKGNPHLKMEDDIEDLEVDETLPDDVEIDAEIGADVADADGDSVSKAAVASAIEDLKVTLGLGAEAEEEFELDTEELPVEEEPVADEEVEAEVDAEEIEEYGDEHPVSTKDAVAQISDKEETKEEGVQEEEATVAENLDEPIEGKSVAQAAKDSSVDDGMEKDKHVKEGEEKSEEKKETIAEAEKKRMAQLAGIIKG